MTFLRGTETKYQIKTKRVLISKEQKTDKKEKDVETQRIRQKSSSTDNIANRKKKLWRTKLIKEEQFSVSPNGRGDCLPHRYHDVSHP